MSDDDPPCTFPLPLPHFLASSQWRGWSPPSVGTSFPGFLTSRPLRRRALPTGSPCKGWSEEPFASRLSKLLVGELLGAEQGAALKQWRLGQRQWRGRVSSLRGFLERRPLRFGTRAVLSRGRSEVATGRMWRTLGQELWLLSQLNLCSGQFGDQHHCQWLGQPLLLVSGKPHFLWRQGHLPSQLLQELDSPFGRHR